MQKKLLKKEVRYRINEEIYVSGDEAKKVLENDMSGILGRISSLMSEKKINQSQLARSIGSEANHINRILHNEQKKNGLTIKVLSRIAVGLGVKIKDLIA
jgi:DNA-binding Xre family transcriptional regulator